jgi:hypothetical protein
MSVLREEFSTGDRTRPYLLGKRFPTNIQLHPQSFVDTGNPIRPILNPISIHLSFSPYIVWNLSSALWHRFSVSTPLGTSPTSRYDGPLIQEHRMGDNTDLIRVSRSPRHGCWLMAVTCFPSSALPSPLTIPTRAPSRTILPRLRA